MLLVGNIRVIDAIDIEENARLSTGSVKLDQLLGGGLPCAGLVELTGESGAGKSQLCQQLTLTVQYPLDQGGCNGSAIYICTEERFQSRRLYQLIEQFPKQYYKHNSNQIDFGNNILIVHVTDFENLEECLKKIPSVVKAKNVKLLVIDSITAIFRGTYTNAEGHKRVREMRTIGSLLHKLSFCYNLLVMCVNQVAQSIRNGDIVPALGLTWANMVTMRLQLIRKGDSRELEVIFSPELPSKISANFSIQAWGITD